MSAVRTCGDKQSSSGDLHPIPPPNVRPNVPSGSPKEPAPGQSSLSPEEQFGLLSRGSSSLPWSTVLKGCVLHMVLVKLGSKELAPMGVQVADDRFDEVGCGAVAAHVSSPHLANFDHLLHRICNHAGVILKVEMP